MVKIVKYKSIHDYDKRVSYNEDLSFDSIFKIVGIILVGTFLSGLLIFIIIINLFEKDKDKCESQNGEYVEKFRGYDCKDKETGVIKW